MTPKIDAIGECGPFPPRSPAFLNGDKGPNTARGHAVPPTVPVDNCSRFESPTGPTTPPAVPALSRMQSAPLLRRRSALKLDASKPAPVPPTPAKQTPHSISVIARSSSVVAPSRDGRAGMLFSRSELRLPRTAPLSVRAYDSSARLHADNVRDSTFGWNGASLSSTGSVLPRQSPNFASLREEEAIRRCWTFAVPSAATCALSPPRLAALDSTRTHSRRGSADGRLENLTATTSTGAPVCESIVATAVSEGGGAAASSSNRLVAERSAPASTTPTEREGRKKAHRHTMVASPSLKEPITPGGADKSADYGQGTDERSKQKRRSLSTDHGGSGRAVRAETPSSVGGGRQKKSWPRRIGGGAHNSSGMSVAEFADKVAALAADVAGVFGIYGRKTAPPSGCGTQPGVE